MSLEKTREYLAEDKIFDKLEHILNNQSNNIDNTTLEILLNKADQFKNNINIIQKDIEAKNLHIITLKKDLKETSNKIWDLCNHEWIRDYHSSFDDLCKYYCKKCTLWKNRHFYT